MAKKQPLSVADARSILANAASYGVDWKPAKAVAEYSDSVAKRFAGQIRRGLAPDRGHKATPEHGTRRTVLGGQEVIVARNPSDAAKARAQARAHGMHTAALPERVIKAREHGAAKAQTLENGASTIHGKSKAAAKEAAQYAAALSEHGGEERRFTGAKRVQVVVYDTAGGRHLMGKRGGMNPQDIVKAMKQPGTVAEILGALFGAIYEHDELEMDWEPSGEFDILIV